MAHLSVQVSVGAVNRIAAQQHGRVTHAQLLALGMSLDAIKHRVAIGRLRRVAHGVYEVGVPNISREGRWMAGVLMGGPGAALADSCALAHWAMGAEASALPEISVPNFRRSGRGEIRVRRRAAFLLEETRVRNWIPVTSPALTVIDNARRLGLQGTERAIYQADAKGHASPKVVHVTAMRLSQVPGAAIVSYLFARRLFCMTATELERWFLGIVRRAGLPLPLTQKIVNGRLVDFHWPDLDLVVETDGGSYHRTPGQQTEDRRRDHAHQIAGTTPLRFTHEQVRYEPQEVLDVLVPVIARLSTR